MASNNSNWRQKVTKPNLPALTHPLPPRPPPASNSYLTVAGTAFTGMTRRHSSAGQQDLVEDQGEKDRKNNVGLSRSLSLKKKSSETNGLDKGVEMENGNDKNDSTGEELVDRTQPQKLGDHIISASPAKINPSSSSVATQTGVEMKLDRSITSYNIHSSFSATAPADTYRSPSNEFDTNPLAFDARIFFPAEPFPPGPSNQPYNNSFPQNNIAPLPFGPPYPFEQPWADRNRHFSNSSSPPDFNQNLPGSLPYYNYDTNYGNNPPSPFFSSPPTDYSNSQFEPLNHFHSHSNTSSNLYPTSNYSNGPPMLDFRNRPDGIGNGNGNGNWMNGDFPGVYTGDSIPAAITDPYYTLSEQNRIDLDLQSQHFAYQLGMEYALATAQDKSRGALVTTDGKIETALNVTGRMELSSPSSSFRVSNYCTDVVQRLNNGMILRRTGTCKFFDIQKGFGFILDDYIEEIGGRDIFVHYTAILQNSGFRCLTTNEDVEYDVVRATSGGYQALNVSGVNGIALKGLQPAAQEMLHARSAEMARFGSDNSKGQSLSPNPPRRILDNVVNAPLQIESNSLGPTSIPPALNTEKELPLLLVKTSNSAIEIRKPIIRVPSTSSLPRGSIDSTSSNGEEEEEDSLQILVNSYGNGEQEEGDGSMQNLFMHLIQKVEKEVVI